MLADISVSKIKLWTKPKVLVSVNEFGMIVYKLLDIKQVDDKIEVTS